MPIRSLEDLKRIRGELQTPCLQNPVPVCHQEESITTQTFRSEDGTVTTLSIRQPLYTNVDRCIYAPTRVCREVLLHRKDWCVHCIRFHLFPEAHSQRRQVCRIICE